jgi:hypothetical protein
MKITSVALCLLLCAVFADAARAERKITANALFSGRAVLMVDNEPVFFALGETHRGITLVKANENFAVIKVDGKEITLYLDKGIAEKYAQAEDLKQQLNSKSHVLSANLIHQTSNIATFEVEYFYSKELGERATLSAVTLRENKPTGHWSHTYTALTPGRNIATITVSMSDKAPASYNSDALRFEINWFKGEEHGATGALVIPFLKTWKQ